MTRRLHFCPWQTCKDSCMITATFFSCFEPLRTELQDLRMQKYGKNSMEEQVEKPWNSTNDCAEMTEMTGSGLLGFLAEVFPVFTWRRLELNLWLSANETCVLLNYHLFPKTVECVRQLWPYLDQDNLTTVIHALVTSRLNYFNALYVELLLSLV